MYFVKAQKKCKREMKFFKLKMDNDIEKEDNHEFVNGMLEDKICLLPPISNLIPLFYCLYFLAFNKSLMLFSCNFSYLFLFQRRVQTLHGILG